MVGSEDGAYSQDRASGPLNRGNHLPIPFGTAHQFLCIDIVADSQTELRGTFEIALLPDERCVGLCSSCFRQAASGAFLPDYSGR